MQIMPLSKQRVEKFSDVAPVAGFLLSGMLPVSEESFAHKSLQKDDIRRILQFASWMLDTEHNWNKDHLFAQCKALGDAMGYKVRDFLFPLFVAIAGTSASVSVVDSMQILGPDMSRARIRHALDTVGGPSKKETKAWEKEYRVVAEALN